MVNAMVERATSDMLIGPDWAMNIEICDICNHDPAQAKDVVRGIKKRLGSKNPKVQLLALTLLETIVKNCGDIVHMHVADKDLPHEMVKIVKKKPDVHVKDKVLTLIDTWQEAFGGARARYPQYYVAFQDLLRLGAVFPQRSENSAPVFTPPQTHPLSSYPQTMRNPEARQDIAESSAEAEYLTMSLAELQNARGIMDVLAEMLSALDPVNREGLKQEVIVDLVEQCCTYKQRVVHLINSTSDESLLSQGLTLNDDLQRVLAKHESFASGAPSIQIEKPRPEPAQTLANVDSPLIDTGDSKQSENKGSTSSTGGFVKQLSLPAPSTPDGQLTTPSKVDPKTDLLSGDDFNSPAANSLVLVPVGQPQAATPVSSQQNALSLVEMFSENNQTVTSGQAYPSSAQFQQQINFNSPRPPVHPNGSISGPMLQQQQLPSPVYGNNNSRVLPPPPWEAELDSAVPTISQPQGIQFTEGVITVHNTPSPSDAYLPRPLPVSQEQVVGAYNGIHLTPIGNPSNKPAGMQHLPIQSLHPMVLHPQPMPAGPMGYIYPQQMYGNQPIGYGYGYGYGYAYNQIPPQNMHSLQQSMTKLSLRNDSSLTNPLPSSSKPSKPEDKLFGDLVDMSKFKPAKTA